MIFAGGILLLIVLVDVCWTALGLMGGGPLSALLARSAWSVAKVLPFGQRARAIAGPLILLLLVLTWSGLLWLGWFLIFYGGRSVMNASSGVEASSSETLYFAGYVIFTLGNGDYAPTGFPWTVLTAVASGTGLIVITLAITYLIAVIAAVVEKRALATFLADLGATPTQLVTDAWTGIGFEPLEQYLPQLASAVGVYSQHHLAYPVLHYFHGEDLRVSVPVRLAAFHEALLILAGGVAPASRLHLLYVEPLRRTIRSFAAVARTEFVGTLTEEPPLPDLRPLIARQIPTVSQTAFNEAARSEAETRQVLRALIEHDSRSWDDIFIFPDN